MQQEDVEELREELIRKEVLNQQDNVKFAYKPQSKKTEADYTDLQPFRQTVTQTIASIG